MTQYALPNANENTTNWAQNQGDGDGDWFDELDEGFGAGRGSGSGPDDATTSWNSPEKPVNEEIKTKLSSVTDPEVSTGHIYRTRNTKGAPSGIQIDIEISLRKSDDTVIASQSFTNVGYGWTTREDTLSSAEADSISDYSDLVIVTKANKVGGGAARSARESAHEFECPDAAGATPKSVSDTLGLSDATPSIAASVPVSDTASLAEALTIAATIPLTDTTSLAEALSIAADIPVSDVANLSDDLAVKAYLALSDTVAFAEAVSIAASLSLSDSVSLSETLSIATFIPVSDTVTLSEAISVLVKAFKTVSDVASISDESVSVVKTEAPAEERLLGGGGRYYRRRRRRARRYKFVTEYDGKGALHVVEELEAQGVLTVRNNLSLTGTSTVTSTLQGGGFLLVKQHLVGSEHQVVCGKIEVHGRSTRYRDVLTALLVYAATGDR